MVHATYHCCCPCSPTVARYVGGQIGTWSYLIQYMQHNVEDTSEKVAADHVFYSLLALAVGRAASTLLLQFVPDVTLMMCYGAINTALCLVGALATGLLGTWALVTTSFFMSLMFPTIFSLAIKGLDKDDTQLGASLIVM